jgi:hypothetical protein
VPFVGAGQRYPDAAGDAVATADIRSLDVTNDRAGTIVVRVATGAPLGANAIGVYLDTDKRSTAGGVGARGIDAFILAFRADPRSPSAAGQVLASRAPLRPRCV